MVAGPGGRPVPVVARSFSRSICSTVAPNVSPSRPASRNAPTAPMLAFSSALARCADPPITAGSSARPSGPTRARPGPVLQGQADLGAEAVDQPPQRRGDVCVRGADAGVPGALRVSDGRRCRCRTGGSRRRAAAWPRTPGTPPAAARPGRAGRSRRPARHPAGHGIPSAAVARRSSAICLSDGSGRVRRMPIPPSSMMRAAHIPVSRLISALQCSISSLRPQHQVPAAATPGSAGRHDLDVGQVERDGVPLPGQPLPQLADVGQQCDRRVQGVGDDVGLHPGVVQPGDRPHPGPVHRDPGRRRPRRPVRSSTARRAAARPAAGWPRPPTAAAGAAASTGPGCTASRPRAHDSRVHRPAGRHPGGDVGDGVVHHVAEPVVGARRLHGLVEVHRPRRVQRDQR